MRRKPELLSAALAKLDAASRRRRRVTVAALSGDDENAQRVVVDGQSLLNFCSNDYLGLAHHPALATAAAQAANDFGSGSGAAHLVCGHSHHHHALEEELADFLGRERTLLFSTGYMANLGVISALASRGEILLADRLSHASLLDGAQLSDARLLRYTHADATAAAQLLNEHDKVSLVVTDGVFSMDGDIAPLRELATSCRARDAWLLVDDAHGIGVLGATGAGSVEAAALTASDVPLLIGTLGKAFGSFGAFLAGEADVVEYVMQQARSYIYTTALPPPVAAASRAALKLVQAESWRREKLMALIKRFRAGATLFGIPLMSSATPIQPLLIGDSQRATQLSTSLRERGFWVGAIRPPTVPENTARLRITLSAAHTEQEVDALLQALGAALGALPLAAA